MALQSARKELELKIALIHVEIFRQSISDEWVVFRNGGILTPAAVTHNTIGSLIASPQLPAVGGDLALQNEILLHNTPMQAVRQKYDLRPKEASQAYDPIQRRFTITMVRQFVDGQLATESRLIAFLQTELVDKGCHRNRKEPYTVNTLKLHVAAITDLLRQQVDFGVNPHPKPRTANVQAILNTYSMNTYERNRDIYADHGAGSIIDGYNTEGMMRIARATLSRPDGYGCRIQGLLFGWEITCFYGATTGVISSWRTS
ncbi:hypothetical protein V1504DRAFT_436529 [Lipomyces starkeyi]